MENNWNRRHSSAIAESHQATKLIQIFNRCLPGACKRIRRYIWHRPKDYGSTADTTQIRKLTTVKRLGTKAILGCYRTTPTTIMERRNQHGSDCKPRPCLQPHGCNHSLRDIRYKNRQHTTQIESRKYTATIPPHVHQNRDNRDTYPTSISVLHSPS